MPVGKKRRILPLRSKIICRFVICFLAEQDFISVEVYKVGALHIAECESINGTLYPHLVPGLFLAIINVYVHRHFKYLAFLLLLNNYHCFVCDVIVIISDIKYGMTGAVIPFVPVPIQVFAGNSLEGKTQLLRFASFKFIVGEIFIERLEECVVTQ